MKRELSIEECEKVLDQAEVGYLAMSRDGQPYCLPFNFVYDEGKIYIHTGVQGTKWDYIGDNASVCFTVAAPGEKRTGESPCQYTYEFESVIVLGRASRVDSPEETADSLQKIIDKYRIAPVLPVPAEKMPKLRMIRIDIERITGRQNL